MEQPKIYEYPKILSLNPSELIDWCNNRKKEMHLSNAKLSELTQVPIGTLDRIFTGKNPEFRYSTIQPIVSFLIGYTDDIPNDEKKEFYLNTIDGYKLAVMNKNHIIDEYRNTYQDLKRQLDYVKKCRDEKQKTIECLERHVEWLEKQFDAMKIETNKRKANR